MIETSPAKGLVVSSECTGIHFYHTQNIYLTSLNSDWLWDTMVTTNVIYIIQGLGVSNSYVWTCLSKCHSMIHKSLSYISKGKKISRDNLCNWYKVLLIHIANRTTVIYKLLQFVLYMSSFNVKLLISIMWRQVLLLLLRKKKMVDNMTSDSASIIYTLS